MKEIAHLVVKTVAEEKTRLITTGAATGTVAVGGSTTHWFTGSLDWVPGAGVAIGFLVVCGSFIKVGLEIRKIRIETKIELLKLAKEGRRHEDK